MNVSIAIMAALFLYGPRSILDMSIRLEVSVHHLLHMRQTDFIEMHIALFLPGTILALLIWGGIHLLSRPLAAKILRLVGGLLAVAIAPLWWFGENYAIQRQYGWNPFQTLFMYEMLAVVVWVFLYSLGKWPGLFWINISILFAHGGFWIWQCGPYRIYIANWQIVPFVGLCSSLVWILYLQKSRQVLPDSFADVTRR
jgi:hypothetical protein